jgi:hypothetical protein
MVRDVPAGAVFYDQWSNYLKAQIASRTTVPGGIFYDPTVENVAIAAKKFLTWMGFPRTVLTSTHRDDRDRSFMDAEVRNDPSTDQDEYFEWKTYRDNRGKITRVIFVTETPEYYEQLWAVDRTAVVNLYRTYVDPGVTEADLHTGGAYNRTNRWNVADGIMHYIMNINTLSAALELAIRSATLNPYRDNYEAPTGPATSVDPRVANDIAMLSRKGLRITLEDPIGLYIAGWNDTGFTRPDGAPAGDYWRILRGSPGMAMRVVYEVPSTEGFVVGDMRIAGKPIQWGGQIAEHMTVMIGGVAGRSSR